MNYTPEGEENAWEINHQEKKNLLNIGFAKKLCHFPKLLNVEIFFQKLLRCQKKPPTVLST
jgi:hypothetical protein